MMVNQENFTPKIFNEKLCGIEEKFKDGLQVVMKADELLYEALADCYILSAEFSGDEDDEAHRILEEKCGESGVEYDENDIQRTLLKLVIKNPHKKGSPERKKENARIATYARALNKLAKKEVTTDDVLQKLKDYGIDYWANGREKEDGKKNSANLKVPLLSKQILNFFDRHNVSLNSFVVFAIGNKVYCSNDEDLIKELKKYKKDEAYEFDDINKFSEQKGH